MTKKQIKMERSPFHKERNMKAPRGSGHLQTQVSQDIYDDFMKYARQYNAQHKRDRGISSKSNPLKHLVNEFLNSHALERQCFTNLYVIMAFNKIDFQTPFNTSVDAAIIGFVDHPYKFTNFHPFRLSSQYKQNIIYALEPFNKDTFDMLNLKTFDREVLFNINPSIYDDFDAVRKQLQSMEEYEHIDFDNAQVCMFNLNNYLDVLHDGVYVSEHSKYDHEGFVVIFDPDDVYVQDRVIARIHWSFNAGVLNFEFDVEDFGLFNTETICHAPRDVYIEYWSTSSGFLSKKAKLDLNLRHSNERIETLENALKLERDRNERITKGLKEIVKRIDDLE